LLIQCISVNKTGSAVLGKIMFIANSNVQE
jgi:hypothetical protein